MSSTWSLRKRLLRRVLLGIALSWAIGLGLAIGALNHEMGELVDESLKGSAQFVLSAYRESGGLNLPAELGDVRIRIIADGQEVLPAVWPVQSTNGGHDLAGWRVFRLSDPDGSLSVEVGQSDKWRREELAESVAWLVAIMLPVLLVALWSVSRVVTATLRPTNRFAQDLQKRKASDLSPSGQMDLPQELAPIRDAMNFYLERIRAHIEAEGQFAVQAAHELRTPVAAASAQAQALMAGVADPAAPQRIADSLLRLGALVDRLLHLSRADAAGAAGAQSDLVQVTRMVIAEMRGDIVFDDGDVESAFVAIHPEALALILENLLRNARDHGTGRVRVLLEAGPVLSILNPVAEGAAFRHGTFEKSARSAGTGLGLGIVQKITGKEGIGLSFSMENGLAKVVMTFTA